MSAMNVAVVVNGGIGETLQTTPLIRTLRTGLPQAHLILVCPGSAEVIASGIRPIDEVVASTTADLH